MAKTEGSLFSLGAHGSVAKTLTFSKRKSGQQCRSYNKPLKAPSAKQRGQRRLTEFLVAQWQNMSDADKATWDVNARASDKNLPGYHYFLREAQRDLYTHHGLAGYWHCNEIVSGQVLDLSGNANHGTLQPSYPSNAPTLVDSEKPKFGKALLYDGIDEEVICADSPSLSITTIITIIFWMKTENLSGSYGLIDKYAGGALNRSYRLFQVDDNIIMSVSSTGDNFESKNIGPNLTLDWVQIAAVFNAGNFAAYKNAIPLSVEGDFALSSMYDSNTPLRFGSRAGLDLFKGNLDEICIYNRALSAAEILTRYNFTR